MEEMKILDDLASVGVVSEFREGTHYIFVQDVESGFTDLYLTPSGIDLLVKAINHDMKWDDFYYLSYDQDYQDKISRIILPSKFSPQGRSSVLELNVKSLSGRDFYKLTDRSWYSDDFDNPLKESRSLTETQAFFIDKLKSIRV